jgi:hypothetical protein
VEAHCLLEGPLLRQAAQLFSRHVLQELLALHHHSPHLLTALHLPGRTPQTLQLKQLLDPAQQKVRLPFTAKLAVVDCLNCCWRGHFVAP